MTRTCTPRIFSFRQERTLVYRVNLMTAARQMEGRWTGTDLRHSFGCSVAANWYLRSNSEYRAAILNGSPGKKKRSRERSEIFLRR